MGEAKDRKQRGIQSVEVGGALLKTLAEADGPLALTDLARRSGLTAAKAHPYLVSYGVLGLIAQDRLTGRYDFGPLALQVGLGALRRLNPLKMTVAALPDLVAATGQTAAVAVWGNHGATVVHIEESTRPLHVNLRVGSVMSLLNTATGNVFAAHLSDAALVPALKREGIADTPTIGAGLAPVLVQSVMVADVRSHGLARTVDHPIPGISAFSAPVFDHRGELALAVTLLGTSATFDANWSGALAGALKTFAARVTADLGGASA